MNEGFKERLLFESSYCNTLALLLEGVDDVEEAQDISNSALKAIANRLKKITSLIGGLPNGAYKKGLQALVTDKIGSNIQDIMDSAKEMTDPSVDMAKAAKEAGVLSHQVDKASSDLNSIIKINAGMMEVLATIILEANLHKGEDKDVPLIQILKDMPDGDKLINSAAAELLDAFESVSQRQAKSAPKIKGFFGKIASSIFGSEDAMDEFEDNKEDLINAILELTPIEIGNFAKSIINYGKEDTAATDKASDKADEVSKTIEDEAASDESKDQSSDDGSKKVSRNDLEDKISKAVGTPGPPILTAIEDAGIFDDLGITFESSLKNKKMHILYEKSLSSVDFDNIVAVAAEKEPAPFEDTDTTALVDDLNDFFSGEEIDINIEKKPPQWNDLDNKSKRRANLSFYLDGDRITGGRPTKEVFEFFLRDMLNGGLELDDLLDIEVDINNYYYDENGKGAQKLVNIPQFVELVNSIIEEREEFAKFKLDPSQVEEDAEEVQSELESAADDAIRSDQSPTAGVLSALEDWEKGLSATSQKQLQAKDRIGQLKDLVKTGIEDGASALEDEVSAAVDIWIDQHEETLVKSRRFSKKNFTTLKQIIPQIVSKLATKENRGGISKSYIKKTTFRYLDNKFGLSKTINESQNYSRLRKLAGI